MNDHRPAPPQDQQNYPPHDEDEINLMDLLRVLWKWKWLIVVGTLICTVAAALIIMQRPKVYEVSAIIEPAKSQKSLAYIEPPDQVSAKIQAGIYNERVRKALAPDPMKAGIAFASRVLKETGMIAITSQWREKETDLGVEATRRLLGILSDDCSAVIELKKGDYNRQIDMKANDLKEIQKTLQVQQDILSVVLKRKEALSVKTEEAKRNNDRIYKQIDAINENGSIDTGVFLALSITVQQSNSYSGQLDRQLYDMEIEAKKADIEKIRLAMLANTIKGELNTLNKEKGMISNMAIINEPEVSPRPISQKTKQVTLFTGIVALFFFVLLAFFIEKIKRR